MYDVPGRADAVSKQVRDAWNKKITAIFNRTAGNHPKTFLSLDPAPIPNVSPISTVRWAANPAVPLACLQQDEDRTRKLCDFGVRGRHVLHNEYLEYVTLFRQDDDGDMRPKRIVMSTELREYWTILAVHAPSLMKKIAESMLGREIKWAEFYGQGITDPNQLNDDDRPDRFNRFVAGYGGAVRGTSPHPTGALNRDDILFMTHPINGLDDLIFIVMFGAKAYFVQQADGTLREPTKFEIFGNGNSLACRNADPAAALGASAQARQGKDIAFANPLGMYIFTDPAVLKQSFTLNGGPIPEEWIQLSRGAEDMKQRLEFGPPDADRRFLDDIMVLEGASQQPLTGGYDVAKKVEVGPLLIIGNSRDLEPSEKILRPPVKDPTPCAQSEECYAVHKLNDKFEDAGA